MLSNTIPNEMIREVTAEVGKLRRGGRHVRSAPVLV